MQWQGDYSEGAFVTLVGIVSEIWNNDDKSLGGMMTTIREKFINNPDENFIDMYYLVISYLYAILIGIKIKNPMSATTPSLNAICK